MRFTDQVAIVTGGGGTGLGSTLAHRFAAEGAAVVVADANGEAAGEVAKSVRNQGGQALGVRTDVRREDDVDAMRNAAVREFGRIDVLVNNAFTSNPASILDARIEDWSRDIDVILKGTFLCSQRVLPTMIGQGKGVIINISSVNAHTHVGASAYSAAKAGVESLTRNLAVEHAPDGIRANALVPGTFRTDVWNEREKLVPDLLERLGSWYPLGHVGTTDDIATAALFLASDEASWITGALLPVDGGLLAGNPRFAREVHPENDR
ncbi:SDR family NAD(P)-dependent oxidoreductase [Amycolatopsis jejuensis]|uniref:SDR family NAD(P)-dependent oxidoreductase n=1 Tax=Amycolatopsis jejuensis TaxID=330084 RepID=UPI0005254EB7|nr:glucose 1-dehydrogenase [Amycolatopsis jejuensis]